MARTITIEVWVQEQTGAVRENKLCIKVHPPSTAPAVIKRVVGDALQAHRTTDPTPFKVVELVQKVQTEEQLPLELASL